MATANSSLSTNFNVEPYYDDFDRDKIFKPSFAVQARELTQSQSILQDQISRFGYHTFKEGSEVSGGSQFIDSSIVVRLESTYGGTTITTSDFEGKYARGRRSQKLFYVKKAIPATGGENDFLHLQSIRVANTTSTVNAESLPFPGEVFDFSANNSLTGGLFAGANTGAAKLITGPTAVANGVLYHVDESIYFTKGFFVKAPKQSVSVSISPNEKKSIGYNVVEELISSSDDSTLLDPASGSYNFTAPGADRFKISLDLVAKDIDDISAPTLSTANYFEVARVDGNKLVRKTPAPNYNVLNDVLAERTFDESGHYIVSGMNINVANTGTNSSVLTTEVTPGKAYVKGYPVQTLFTANLPLLKARDTEAVTEQNMTALYGNYVFANTISTGLFDIGDKVDLHANTTPTPGDKIGEAYIKNIEYFSGSDDGRVYKIFLYDIKNTSPELTFDTTKSIVTTNATNITASALIHSTGRTEISKFGSTTAGANTILLNNASGVSKGQLLENATHFPERTTVTDITFDTITVSQNALLSNTNASLTFSSTKLNEKDFHRAIFPLPNKNVTNVTNVDYKFKRKFATVTFTSGVATIQTLGGTERFSSGAGSLANENYFVVVKSGGTGSLVNGDNVDLTAGSRSVSTPTPTPGSPASAVIDLDEGGFNGTCDIIAAIDVTGDSRRVKTFANNETKTFDPIIAGTKYSLGFSDVFKINAIYEGNSNTVNVNSTVVTSNFNFDSGQRDNFYDHATIQLKTGQANTAGKILVDFDRFSSSGGKGFFVADSYPNYQNIPTYTDQKGEIVELRDVIDFRPIRSANTSSNNYVSLNKSFEDHQIVDSQTFEVEMDYEYYLKRVSKLLVDQEGRFEIKNGESRLKNPPEPADDPAQITLATFRLNPYTYDEQDMQVKINNNARYTMKDIGDIDRRVEKIETITSLNALENQINNKTFIDENGDVLFKNGFLVDSFRGHSIGDVFNPDYNVAIDRTAGILHPPFDGDSVPLVISSGTTTNVGDYVTVPYNQTPYLTQNTASSTINVNPFQITTFVGTAKLDPDTDVWVDFDTAPVIVVNDEGDLDHLRNLQSQAGTEWGSWRTTSRRTSGGFKIRTKKRTGTVKSVEVDEVLVSETKREISNVFYYFMRSRKVNFELTGMRPNTRIYVFMNGTNIMQYAAPSTVSANTVEDVRYLSNEEQEILTDDNGSATGFFFVPNDSKITRRANTAFTDTGNVNGINIPVGTVPVLFTDNYMNTLKATTYARADYTATGRKVTTQTTQVMTKEYSLVTDTVSDSKTTRTRISTPPPVNPDPVTVTGGTDGTDDVVEDTKKIVGSVIVNGGTGEIIGSLPPRDSTEYFIDSDATFNEALDNIGYDESTHPASENGISAIVSAFYVTELGRKPDQGGFEYWAKDIKDRFDKLEAAGLSEAEARTQALGETRDIMERAAKENGENRPEECRELGGKDPLAQTFFIDESFYPKGIFVTSVDLFFATKDENLPVRIELRPTENGFPSSTYAIPQSSVSKNPSEVSVNTEGNLTPTRFTFDNAIHLLPGEYSIVVLTDSFEYSVYRSVIGEQRLGSTEFITEQPTLGSLFKSQNARTWTPSQNEDLCFVLRKALFATDQVYTTTLAANNVARVEYNASSNTVGKFDIAHITIPEFSRDNMFDVTYKISTKPEGGVVSSFVDIQPNEDIFFDLPQELTADSDLRLQVSMRTTNKDISPYFDKSAVAATLIKNRINAPADIVSNPETAASGGGAIARYITRKVNLAEGFDATALKVFVDQNMPAGSTVQVYYKVKNENDDTPFNERPYVQLTRVQTDIDRNEELDEFTEYEYRAEGITYTQDGALFNSFDQFVIKVVLLSTSTASAPTLRNIRAIAFA